jgi:hypothetical protein
MEEPTKPEVETPNCFLDKERKCSGDCMAFVHTMPQGVLIQCGILMNLNALSEVRDILKGNPKGVTHPVSAPPPEVTQ